MFKPVMKTKKKIEKTLKILTEVFSPNRSVCMVRKVGAQVGDGGWYVEADIVLALFALILHPSSNNK